MARRLSRIATLSAALLATLALASTVPAAAVGPFGPAETLYAGCGAAGDAAIAADGTTRAFADCTGLSSGQIWFFRDTPASAPVRERTPYTGVVYAVAWDGADTTYVVFQTGSQLKIGKRVESSGAYSPLTTLTTGPAGFLFTADVIASNGHWWTVWSERVAAGTTSARSQLFQAHTLFSVQGRTRITSTAANVSDREPTLAFTNGRVTMVWTRETTLCCGGGQPADLWIAASTGGAWSSRPFASLGHANREPDLTIYGGVTWVTWDRDLRTVVASNAGGTFQSLSPSTTAGYEPTIAVSGSHVFVAWTTFDDNRTVLAEQSGGAWTGTQIHGPGSYPLRVLAQGTKARVIYAAADSGLSSAPRPDPPDRPAGQHHLVGPSTGEAKAPRPRQPSAGGAAACPVPSSSTRSARGTPATRWRPQCSAWRQGWLCRLLLVYGRASPLAGGTPSAITTAKPWSRQPVRSGKHAAHEPAGLAAAVSGGLADAAESVCLEQRDGTHVTGGLVDAFAARVDRVAFQHGGAGRVRMPDRAVQQLVHQAAAPEPRPHHEAHHRPRSLVLDVRDRPGVDQGAVGGLRRHRAPAGRLAIDVRQHSWAWFAGAQRAHVRDTAGHVEAGIAVRHADASACAWLARHHKRREILPSPSRRQHLDSHAPRIGPPGQSCGWIVAWTQPQVR